MLKGDKRTFQRIFKSRGEKNYIVLLEHLSCEERLRELGLV